MDDTVSQLKEQGIEVLQNGDGIRPGTRWRCSTRRRWWVSYSNCGIGPEIATAHPFHKRSELNGAAEQFELATGFAGQDSCRGSLDWEV